MCLSTHRCILSFNEQIKIWIIQFKYYQKQNDKCILTFGWQTTSLKNLLFIEQYVHKVIIVTDLTVFTEITADCVHNSKQLQLREKKNPGSINMTWQILYVLPSVTHILLNFWNRANGLMCRTLCHSLIISYYKNTYYSTWFCGRWVLSKCSKTNWGPELKFIASK